MSTKKVLGDGSVIEWIDKENLKYSFVVIRRFGKEVAAMLLPAAKSL